MAPVKLASRKVLDLLNRQYLTAKIVNVDFDRVDVIPQGSSGILRGVPLVGDPEAVVPGDTVLVANHENGKRIAFSTGEQSGSRNVNVSLSFSGGGGGSGLPDPELTNSILLSDGEEWIETTLESLGLVDAVELGMILLYASGQAVRAYPFTPTGFDQALAAAAHGNVVFVPGRDLDGDHTIPASVYVECNGTAFRGKITLSPGCSIGGASILNYGSGNPATALIGPTTGGASLRDCYLLGQKTDGAVELVTLNGGDIDFWNCILIADASTNAYILAVGSGNIIAYGCTFEAKAPASGKAKVVKQHMGGEIRLYNSKLSAWQGTGAVEELAPNPTVFHFTGPNMELPAGMSMQVLAGAYNGDGVYDGGDGGRAAKFRLNLGRKMLVNKASFTPYVNHYWSTSITYFLGGVQVRSVGTYADEFPIECDAIEYYASSFSTGGPTGCGVASPHAEYETIGASSAAYTYACQMHYPTGIPMDGDLGAWDAARFPTKHANDVSTGVGLHHRLGTGANEAARGNHAHALDALSDVDLTTKPPAVKNALVFDGTNWVPGPSGHVVQNEGADVPLRDYLDFVGEVLVEDIPGQNKTRVTFPAIEAPGERLYAYSPLGRPTGTLLRRYTFDNGVEGWTANNNMALTSTPDGYLRLDPPDGTDGTALEPLALPAVDNFEMYFTIRLSDTQSNDFGVHFRMQDFNNGYMLAIRAWNGTVFQLYRKEGGGYNNIGGAQTYMPLYDGRTPMKVLIRAYGPRITCYINDVLVGQVYDTRFTSGLFGFRSYHYTTYVDNLEIYSISDAWDLAEYMKPRFVGYTAGHKVYRDAKQNILTLETPNEGSLAVTADTQEMGFYVGGAWHWTEQRPLVDDYLDLNEIPKPTAPGENTLRLYARDVDGISRMFVQRPDGSETEILSGADNTGLMVKKKAILVWEPITSINLTADQVISIDLPDKDYKFIWGFGRVRQSYSGSITWTRWRANDVPYASNNYLTYYHHAGSGHNGSGTWDDVFGHAPGDTSHASKFEEFEIAIYNANRPGVWKRVNWKSNTKWGAENEANTYLWETDAYWLNKTDRLSNLKIFSYDRGLMRAGSYIELYGLRVIEVVTDVFGDPDSGGAAWVLDDLDDVDLTTPPISGEALIYDGEKWTSGAAASMLVDLTDVDITTNPPDVGNFLMWDGSEWVPGEGGTGGGGGSGHVIESNEVDVPARGQLDFVGFDVTDDAAGDRTKIALPSNFTQATGTVLKTEKQQTRKVIFSGYPTAGAFDVAIPSGYDHLEMRIVFRNVSSGSAPLLLTLNGDTNDANYWHAMDYGGSGTGSALNSTPREVGQCPGSTDQVGNFGSSVITISKAGWSNKRKIIHSDNYSYRETSGGGYVIQYGVNWAGNEAVNRVQFTLNGVNNYFHPLSLLEVVAVKEADVITGVSGTLAPGGAYESQAFVPTQLAKHTLQQDATAFPTISLPSGYEYVDIIINNLRATVQDVLNIAFNGDTDNNNYLYTEHYGGSGHSTGNYNIRQVMHVPDAGYDYRIGALRIRLHNYDDPNNFKNAEVFEQRFGPNGSYLVQIGFIWYSKAVIKTVSFALANSSSLLKAGARVLALGYKNQTIGSSSGSPVSVSKEDLTIEVPLIDEWLTAPGILDFQNIPADYDDLKVIISGTSTDNGCVWAVQTINEDTNHANYCASVGYTGSGFAGYANNVGWCGSVSVPGSAGFFEATYFGYARNGAKRPFTMHTFGQRTDSRYTEDISGYWNSTSPITRLRIAPTNQSATGQFAAGTHIQVFGVKKKKIVTDVQNVSGEVLYGKKLLYDKELKADGIFDWENIPQNYDHLEIVLSARSAAAAPSDEIRMYYNNDLTESNYRNANGVGGSGGGGQVFGNSLVGYATGSQSPEGWFSTVGLTLKEYTSDKKIKVADGFANSAYNLSYTYVYPEGCIWKSTAPVNRITIKPPSANFAAGSRLQIFGYKNMATQAGVTTAYVGHQLLKGDISGQTYVDIDVSDQNLDHIEIKFDGRSSKTADMEDFLYISFNDDFDNTHYTFDRHWAGDSHGASRGAERSIGSAATAISAVAYEGRGQVIIDVPEPKSDLYKQALSRVGNRLNNYTYLHESTVFWNYAAPITKIRISLQSGLAFDTGSRLTVIGYKNTLLGSSEPKNAALEGSYTLSPAPSSTYPDAARLGASVNGADYTTKYKLNDGMPTTSSFSDACGWDGTNQPTITLDLESKMTGSTFVVRGPAGWAGLYRPAGFTLSYSDDGSTWTQVKSCLGLNPGGQAGYSPWKITQDVFAYGSHRYWRVYLTKGSTEWLFVDEVEFWT